MQTEQISNETALENLKSIIAKGGPCEKDYLQFEHSLSALVSTVPSDQMLRTELLPMIDSCQFLFDRDSVMGHIRTKPHGYAGDFEIIERIYQNQVLRENYKLWDTYSLKHPAAQAVRNRKKYFKSLLRGKLEQAKELTLLNIASGPGRDLFEVYQEIRFDERLSTTCVEMDGHAIDYARGLTDPFSGQISFIKKNIFRFSTQERYDLVWSAGLFDYFDDKAFVMLLKRFRQWVNPGGEIVIGNFNDEHNPSRLFMELFGQWHLNHRSEQELIRLAGLAGYSQAGVCVGREPENINLFLHLRP
ncbi:MAG: class I SAM-dependent methyltransferase [Pedobacter sp.]|nr:MAG: class I SAM-dependent methyltransferase [Pedobacter sp.]